MGGGRTDPPRRARGGAGANAAGAHPGAAAALRLPLALKSLRRVHPKLSLRVQTDTSAVLIDQVLAELYGGDGIDTCHTSGPVEVFDCEL